MGDKDTFKCQYLYSVVYLPAVYLSRDVYLIAHLLVNQGRIIWTAYISQCKYLIKIVFLPYVLCDFSVV